MTPALTAEAAILAHLAKGATPTIPAIAEAAGRTRSGIASAAIRLYADGLLRFKPQKQPSTQPRNGRLPDILILTTRGERFAAKQREGILTALGEGAP